MGRGGSAFAIELTIFPASSTSNANSSPDVDVEELSGG